MYLSGFQRAHPFATFKFPLTVLALWGAGKINVFSCALRLPAVTRTRSSSAGSGFVGLGFVFGAFLDPNDEPKWPTVASLRWNKQV